MADPLIEEQYMLSLLSLPANVGTVAQIKQGSLLSCVDAVDRKILRDPLIDILALSLSLTDTLGRMEIVQSMLPLLKDGSLKEENLVEANATLVKMAEEKRLKLLRMMNNVADCPMTGETVN